MSTPEENRPAAADEYTLEKAVSENDRADAAHEPATDGHPAAGTPEAEQPEPEPIEFVRLVENGETGEAGDTTPATLADASGGSLPPADANGTLPAEPDDGEEDGGEEDEEEDEPGDGEGGRMSLMDHLRELRQRVLYSLGFVFVGFLVCWAFVEPVFDVLTRPMLDALPKGGTAMYTTLPEAFFTRMYIAFFLGLFVASPFVFYQIWAFISPGLYEEEKHFILPVALVSAVFFIAGGLFCYHVVFTYAFNFFMGFVTEDIQAMPKISEYLEFVLKMLLAFGLIFEMPIFAFFLSRMGIITAKGMRGVRRYAILIIFIVAAILTPPDVVSQLLMALPMLLLYEVSILVAAVFGKKTKEEPALADEDDEEDEDWDEEEEEEEEDEESDEEDRDQSEQSDLAAVPGAGSGLVAGEERPHPKSSAFEGALPESRPEARPGAIAATDGGADGRDGRDGRDSRDTAGSDDTKTDDSGDSGVREGSAGQPAPAPGEGESA